MASSSSKASAGALRGRIIIAIRHGESKAAKICRVSIGDTGFDTSALLATYTPTAREANPQVQKPGFTCRMAYPMLLALMSQLILEAGRTEQQYWRDLWRYRELFYVLAWRDISVRYKQTVIGVLWALIQPLATMLIGTFIFGKIAALPSGGIPYILLVAAGQLPWQFFANALTSSSQSLVGNANLISKIYFPRLIIPASAIVTTLVDFLIAFLLTVCVMAYCHYVPPVQILLLPLFIVMAFLTALGPGLIFTALNVKFRDFRIIIPFMVQFGVYISPVFYTSSLISDKYGALARLIYSLNPVVGVIDGFRWAILGGKNEIYLPGFFLSLSITALLLFIGIRYFRNTERTFADVI